MLVMRGGGACERPTSGFCLSVCGADLSAFLLPTEKSLGAADTKPSKTPRELATIIYRTMFIWTLFFEESRKKKRFRVCEDIRLCLTLMKEGGAGRQECRRAGRKGREGEGCY